MLVVPALAQLLNGFLLGGLSLLSMAHLDDWLLGWCLSKLLLHSLVDLLGSSNSQLWVERISGSNIVRDGILHLVLRLVRLLHRVLQVRLLQCLQ